MQDSLCLSLKKKWWWKEIRRFVYAIVLIFFAFSMSYPLYLITFTYDEYESSNVVYTYDSVTGRCKSMIVAVPDNWFPVFDTCLFDLPVKVYRCHNVYTISEEEFEDYKTSTRQILDFLLYFPVSLTVLIVFVICGKLLWRWKTRVRVLQESTCAICQEVIATNDVDVFQHLECKQFFHQRCISRCFEFSMYNCPICRISLR